MSKTAVLQAITVLSTLMTLSDAKASDDVVWQNINGQIMYWPMINGVAQNGIEIFTPVNNEWILRDVGDVNGDGASDIIWQHVFGQVHYWPMINGIPQAGIDIHTPMGNDWSLKGVGDVNGDGTDDIVWQNISGQVAYWPMIGGVAQPILNIFTPMENEWNLKGVGDVNGDGTDDIIWQHVFGQVHYWPMTNGVAQTGIDIHTPIGNEWILKSVGDVNGDGTDDIVWQHIFGQVHYWPITNGVAQAGINIHTPMGNEWVLKGVGDVNAVPVCGNNVLEHNETCDDGNTTSGDGCSEACQVEPPSPDICLGEEYTYPDSTTGYTKKICYYISSSAATNWDQAEQICRTYYAADLSFIPDAGADSLLKNLVTTQYPGVNFFIGINDRVTEGNYVWDSGDTTPYLGWHVNEPNNFGGDQDCTVLSGQFEGNWDDGHCDRAEYYICSVNMESCGNGIVENTETCDDGNTTAGDGCSASCEIEPPCTDGSLFTYVDANGVSQNICYHVVNSPLPWNDANSYCQTTYSGHLAFIPNADADAFVKNLLFSQFSSGNFLFGLSDLASEGNFVWEGNNNTAYTDWFTGEPNNQHDQDWGDQDCAAISLVFNAWDDVHCSENLAFVCSEDSSL